jgi:hypothetical protein
MLILKLDDIIIVPQPMTGISGLIITGQLSFLVVVVFFPRGRDTKAKLLDGRLTFDAVGTMLPNGDIFTNRSFVSSTNQFLLRFDYAATAACDQIYVAWFYDIPASEAVVHTHTPRHEKLRCVVPCVPCPDLFPFCTDQIPIHGWAATSRPDYCAQVQSVPLLVPVLWLWDCAKAHRARCWPSDRDELWGLRSKFPTAAAHRLDQRWRHAALRVCARSGQLPSGVPQ